MGLLVFVLFIVSVFVNVLLFSKKQKIKKTIDAIYDDAVKRAEKKAKENVEILRGELNEKLKKQTELLNKANSLEAIQKESLKKIEVRELVLEKKEHEVHKEKKENQNLKCALEEMKKELEQKQFELTKTSKDQARNILFKEAKNEIDDECAKYAATAIDDVASQIKERAHKLLLSCIERFPYKQITDTSVTFVLLPTDEIKARLIGRDGRNIRFFENLTGVHVSFDESKPLAILSCFDPIRRYIAKTTLELLVEEIKIHPSLIEECVKKQENSIEQSYITHGKKAASLVRVTNLHPELVKTLGKLYYHSSCGQNVLEHSVEVSFLMGEIAQELGLRADVARRIGLLHDIGKASKDGFETHAKRGFRLAMEYGESECVAYGIGSHHDEMKATCFEGSLCKVCDAISATRKGARQEQNDRFITKIRTLESLAEELAGVESAYAMQNGKELRVFVLPEIVDDLQSKLLAKTLAEKIQSEMKHIGKVQITVVRQTQCIEFTSSV